MTKQWRVIQCVALRKQLHDINISTEDKGMQELQKRIKQFVDEAISWSGVIKLISYNVYAHVILTNNVNKNCSIKLSKYR